jgi:hypothetical protein
MTLLNAWAIVNNLRVFLPGAQKTGQSLAQVFGAKVKGILWMEVLNLWTVTTLQNLIPTLSKQTPNSKLCALRRANRV